MPIIRSKISRIRALHAQAQRSYAWEFDFPDHRGVSGSVSGVLPSEERKFLAVRATIPGIQVEDKPYFIGGQEAYTTGKIKRGGVVRAAFIEIEGGQIDSYFRSWMNGALDGRDAAGGQYDRIRFPKSRYAVRGSVTFRKTDDTASFVFQLISMIPISVGPYELTYDGSGALILPVELRCDEVRRVQ